MTVLLCSNAGAGNASRGGACGGGCGSWSSDISCDCAGCSKATVLIFLTRKLCVLDGVVCSCDVFAVVGGYFALGETLDAQQLVGAAVTLGGIYLVNKNAGGNDGS